MNTDTLSGKKQFLLALQIAVGVVICVGAVRAWLDAGLPLWEVQSEDSSYVLGWRSAVVLFAVLLVSQCVSYLIFRPFIRWAERPKKT